MIDIEMLLEMLVERYGRSYSIESILLAIPALALARNTSIDQIVDELFGGILEDMLQEGIPIEGGK